MIIRIVRLARCADWNACVTTHDHFYLDPQLAAVFVLADEGLEGGAEVGHASSYPRQLPASVPASAISGHFPFRACLRSAGLDWLNAVGHHAPRS